MLHTVLALLFPLFVVLCVLPAPIKLVHFLLTLRLDL